VGVTDLGIVENGSNGFGRGVDWAGNDTLLVPNATGAQATLLTVKRHP